MSRRFDQRGRRLTRGAMLALLAVFFAAGEGCAGSRTAARSQPMTDADIHASLVLPADPMLSAAAAPFTAHPQAAWEFGRNDAAISVQPFAATYPDGWKEIYTRDRFSTYGGRLHEHSRYEIRSYRIR